MWTRYCAGTSAIAFLVDASVPCPRQGDQAVQDGSEEGSKERQCHSCAWKIASQELHTLIKQPSLQEIPVLVLAAKNDVPNCATTSQVVDLMKLHDINDREVFCYSISIRNMQNIDKTLQWLCARQGNN